MSHYIKRIRRSSVLRGLLRGKLKGPADLPLDKKLTFSPHPDEEWTFEDERQIRLNDVDVKELVAEQKNDVGLLCGVSSGLYAYQQFVWSKGGKSNGLFNGTVASLQDTILERLGTIYDGLTGGVNFECDGDDLWINNVNVGSVLKLYRIKPTGKARTYLIGLRDKLRLILSRQRSSTRYDGSRPQVTRLLNDINLALDCVPPADPVRLLSGRRSA